MRKEDRLLKKLIYLLFILILISGLISGCSSSNPYVYKGIELLKNGNMEEEDSKGNPIDWSEVPSDDTSLALYTEPVTKNKFLGINGLIGATITNCAYWYQTIEDDDIPIGKKVKLTVRIKTENLTGKGAAIAIRCDNSELGSGVAEQFVSTENRINISGTNDWKTYSVELDRIEEGIDHLVIYLIFLTATSGTVYFDDASLIY